MNIVTNMAPFFSVPSFSRTWSKLLLASGGLYLTSRYIGSSTAQCNTPSLTLYQYKTCPFCCKTRAFLDYYGYEYKSVEVNPLTRKEIKFSKYKKVPFITVDNVQLNDSSLLISVLRSSAVLKSHVSQSLDMYPEVSFTDGKGREQTERANKYFIMYGETPVDNIILNKLREERQWREWVDTHLVHTFSANIYRTPHEALQAFQYISTVGNFNVIERILAKYFGAVLMYIIGKRLKKKWKLHDNVRLSLYQYCDEWIKAIGEHRQFMGGDEPNLADLAVYGCLSALEGLETFDDVLVNTNIRSWYYAVQEKVIRHDGKRLLQ